MSLDRQLGLQCGLSRKLERNRALMTGSNLEALKQDAESMEPSHKAAQDEPVDRKRPEEANPEAGSGRVVVREGIWGEMWRDCSGVPDFLLGLWKCFGNMSSEIQYWVTALALHVVDPSLVPVPHTVP